MSLLLLSIAWAGGCNLQSLNTSMTVLENDLAQRWWAVEEQSKRVVKELECLKEPVGQATLLKIHEQLAVAAHIRKDFDDAAAHLVAAWISQPMMVFPSAIPSTSPARGRFAALQEKILSEGTVVRLDRPAYVDGHWASWVYEELPMIVQEPGKKPRIMGR
jgi:hypothetical protein